MNLLLDGTTIGWAFVALISLTIVLIYFLRHYFSSATVLRKGSSPIQARNKYTAVNVFKWSGTFLRIGMVVSLAFVVLAFNYTAREGQQFEGFTMEIDKVFEVEPPRTKEPPKLPPPPPVKIEIPDDPVEDTTVFVDQSLDIEEEIIAEPLVTPAVKKPTQPVLPPPPDPIKEEEIIFIAEQMPRFPGCEAIGGDKKAKDQCATKALLKFLSTNLNYPSFASENSIQGTVVISFVVEKDGSLTGAKIIKDPGGGLGKEALRVVNLMNSMNEKWTPGKQNARPVRVQFNLPVKFRLD